VPKTLTVHREYNEESAPVTNAGTEQEMFGSRELIAVA
jgi:hypothetical protein